MVKTYSAMKVEPEIINIQIDDQHFNFEKEHARRFAREILAAVYSSDDKKDGKN